MFRLRTKESLMLNTITSSEKSGEVRPPRERTMKDVENVMHERKRGRQEGQDREGRRPLRATCHMQQGLFKVQGSGVKPVCTSYQFLLTVRARTAMQRKNSVQTPE